MAQNDIRNIICWNLQNLWTIVSLVSFPVRPHFPRGFLILIFVLSFILPIRDLFSFVFLCVLCVFAVKCLF